MAENLAQAFDMIARIANGCGREQKRVDTLITISERQTALLINYQDRLNALEAVVEGMCAAEALDNTDPVALDDNTEVSDG